MPHSKHLILFLVCALFLGACANTNPVLELVTTSDRSTLSATLSERDLQGILNTYAQTSDPQWLIAPVVDLQNGQMVIKGAVKQDNQTTPASLTATASARQGILVLNVTALNYGTYNASAADLESINRNIAAGIAQGAIQQKNDWTLDEVTINDGSLTVKVSAANASGVGSRLKLTTTDTQYLLDVSLTTDEVRALLLPIFYAGESPWLRDPVIVLNNGLITIRGGLVNRETGEVTATQITLSIGAENGWFRVGVQSLSFNTWEVPPAWLKGVNDGLAKGFAASDRNSGLVIQNFTVTTSGITLRMEIPRR